MATKPCKYGILCRRKDCKFSHVPLLKEHSPIICKYGGACKRPDCHFQHVKQDVSKDAVISDCIFGVNCTRKGCWYSHPQMPKVEEIFTQEELDELKKIGDPMMKCPYFDNEDVPDKFPDYMSSEELAKFDEMVKREFDEEMQRINDEFDADMEALAHECAKRELFTST